MSEVMPSEVVDLIPAPTADQGHWTVTVYPDRERPPLFRVIARRGWQVMSIPRQTRQDVLDWDSQARWDRS